MKFKFLTLFLMLFCFLIGAYAWRIKNTGKRNLLNSSSGISELISNEDLLAEIEDESIYLEDIDFESDFFLKNMKEVSALNPKAPELKKLNKQKLLHAAIERKILYKFATRDSSFDKDNEKRKKSCQQFSEKFKAGLSHANIQRLKNRLCEQSLIEQYCREKVFKKTTISEGDLLKYYKEHMLDFNQKAEVKIRQIVLDTENEAKWVLARVSRKNFSEMAQKYSVTPESKNGGRLAPFHKGDFPQIFDMTFSLPLDQPQGIFKSTYGFHIFLIDERRVAKQLSFQEVKGHIQKILIQEMQSQEYRDWVELASRSVNVRILRSF